jgi:hypothetical protein
VQLFVSVATVGVAGWTLGVTNDLMRERAALTERVVQLEQELAQRNIRVPEAPTRVDRTEAPPSAADSRSQTRNRETATERFGALVAAALKPRKKRKPTRVSPAQKRARLEAKRRRSAAKRLRGRVRPDD